MSKELLAQRSLPPILTHEDGGAVTPDTWAKRREEMLRALSEYSYGYTPAPPTRVFGEILEEKVNDYAGKVHTQTVRISFESQEGIFSFPVKLAIPNKVTKPAIFLHLAFESALPYKYAPLEEITDAGYAVALVGFEDLVNDRHYGDYSDGLAAYFHTTTDRKPDEWGKIGMWAYGLSRVMDYLVTREDIDSAHTALIGHSRTGKAALWAGAQDERFWCVISNDSGYGGAATSKCGEGERVTDFIAAGSWDWFCPNFLLFTGDKEDQKPYDQSWLLALMAPRYLCVGSAALDTGADPKSEFLTTLHASKAWELLGKPGLVVPDRLPVPGDESTEGCIGYHLRDGGHFLSREDWQAYIRFLDAKLK